MTKMKYVRSAVFAEDYPAPDRPEVAVAGRSNSGKSSLLNALGGSKVARVSQEPGKTRLLNFFDFGAHYRFTDMPGYGFAARGGDEIKEWTRMIENYLSLRENLQGLVLLMDIRRDWAQEEEMLKQFCHSIDKPICLVLTKSDKCSKQEKANRLKELKKKSGVDDVYVISSQEKQGLDELEEFIFRRWIKDYNPKGDQ